MSRPTRVIALEWNVSMLIDVLVELSVGHNWEPIYCVSLGTREQLKRRFPSAIYQDTYDARFGRAPPELADMRPVVIDQPTAEVLGYAQVTALKQMERMNILGDFA